MADAIGTMVAAVSGAMPSASDDMFANLSQDFETALQQLDVVVQGMSTFKDNLLGLELPTETNLELLANVGSLQAAMLQLSVPALDMLRLVDLYREPWGHKNKAFISLHESYERHQRQLQIALTQLEQTQAALDVFERERPIQLWQRVVLRVLAIKTHSRRWASLLPAYRQRVMAGLAANPLSDDEDDEDADGSAQLPLPVKPVTKHRVPPIVRSLLARERGETEGSAGVTERLQKEVLTLRRQLQEAEENRASTHKAVQAGIPTRKTAPEANLAGVPTHYSECLVEGQKQLAAEQRDRAPLRLVIHLIDGWQDCTPPDLVVEAALLHDGLSKAVSKVSLPADPFDDPPDADTSSFELVLPQPERNNALRIRVFGAGLGPHAQCLVDGLVSCEPLLDASLSHSNRIFKENVGITVTCHARVSIRLPVTAGYQAYRREADARSRNVEDINLIASFACGDARSPGDRAIRGTNGRQVLLRTHRAALTDMLTQTCDDLTDDLFNLLDVNSEDLDKANFTLQEMMDLAMLHAYQMQALNAQHEDQLEEVRAAARRVQQDLQELLTEHPELKQMHHISSQTDLLFESSVKRPVSSARAHDRRGVGMEQSMGLGEFGAPLEDRDPLEELDALPDSRDIQARRPTFDPSRFGSTLPKGFLNRLLYYAERSLERRQSLLDRVITEERYALEGTLASKQLLDDAKPGPDATTRPPSTRALSGRMPISTGHGATLRYSKSRPGQVFGLESRRRSSSSRLPPLGGQLYASQARMASFFAVILFLTHPHPCDLQMGNQSSGAPDLGALVLDARVDSPEPLGTHQGESLRRQGLMPNGRPAARQRPGSSLVSTWTGNYEPPGTPGTMAAAGSEPIKRPPSSALSVGSSRHRDSLTPGLIPSNHHMHFEAVRPPSPVTKLDEE
ncbi:uncharacterized protein MONBRDRAFT_39180 [Monosiga brevicollis MX1]|uniref:Uncharacterized protein n=1 Tax=Monosiga brevicollis TaxID=81824 RepID=A9VCQ4_MONBE|nr:uncharacterized protein MONBRDRAFT_39180 [Monosiga brevicollis MX1]EDQ84688.1 predicted protein [Monosiga brevicollis MX1]|eukprot:XP_001750474.1 hypothetical protein [Monosiga brevicollis MX1]